VLPAAFLGDAAAGTRVPLRHVLLDSLARLAVGSIWQLIHFVLLDCLFVDDASVGVCFLLACNSSAATTVALRAVFDLSAFS
jgi:hypothetical protein